MYVSIIGKKGSGKTTFFKALSGINGEIRPCSDLMAVIEVPDERIDRLSEIFRPRKKVYARITIADTIPIEKGIISNEKVDPNLIKNIRESDAFLMVIKNFDNGCHMDMAEEFFDIYNEFILSDIIQIENRLQRITKQKGKKEQPGLAKEEGYLKACLAHLNEGKPLVIFPATKDEENTFRGFRFLSLKPLLIVVNCDEKDVALEGDTISSELRAAIPPYVPIITACGKLEAELAFMSKDEQGEFMKAYGIEEAISKRIIRALYEKLGLISFFTVGEDECRAWPIKIGTNAQEAAATIHTELSKKFIRAETVSYEDFMRLGCFSDCKKAGLLRLEGKSYTVKDGDILSIRAGN